MLSLALSVLGTYSFTIHSESNTGASLHMLGNWYNGIKVCDLQRERSEIQLGFKVIISK